MGNTDKFDKIADIYDTPERMKIAEVSAEAIREFLVDTENRDAIDFGCGTGLVGMSLLNAFRSMIFLDSSSNMIEQIRHKIAVHQILNAEAICFDLEERSIADVHADYIFMAQVLLHIQNVEPVLSRLREVLNENGHLIIVDFDKNEKIVSDIVHNGFNQNELRGTMRKIGFHNIQSKTFYSGQGLFMGHDASMFVLDSRK
jgi:ubiquinone/menaquinone biosynthesis C-methylase UbiE